MGTPRKLTDTDVALMRTLRDAGWYKKDLAAEFHVGEATVWRTLATPEQYASYLERHRAYKASKRAEIKAQQQRYRMGLGSKQTQTMPFYKLVDY